MSQEAEKWWDQNEQGRGPRPRISAEAEANMYRHAYERIVMAVGLGAAGTADRLAIEATISACVQHLEQLRLDARALERVREAVDYRERRR